MACLRLDGVSRRVYAGVTSAGPGRVAERIWEYHAMFHSPACECGAAGECRYAALAAECVLDAAGTKLLYVDDWAIPVDVLRSLPASEYAGIIRRGHYFLPARHSIDRGTRFAALSETRRD